MNVLHLSAALPPWLHLIVLILAGHRIARIVGWDSITQPWRERILGYSDDGKKNRWPANRKKLGEFVHCPWCQGFWLSIAGWLAYAQWPDAVLLVAVPLAISSAIGAYTVNLDA